MAFRSGLQPKSKRARTKVSPKRTGMKGERKSMTSSGTAAVPPSSSWIEISKEGLELIRGFPSTCKKVELKDRIETKGDPDGSPTQLLSVDPGRRYRLMIENSIALKAIRGMMGSRTYRFRLSNVVTISSNGSGILNSVLAASTLGSTTDWTAFSSIFSEFFILSYSALYEPVSMYNYPLTGVVATSVSSLPVGLAALQHGEAAYTSVSSMANHSSYEFHNTGKAFVFHWKNNENPRAGVLVNPVSGGSTLVQGWCLTSDVSNYTGQIQYLTASAPPALPVSEVVGNITTHYYVLFRIRA